MLYLVATPIGNLEDFSFRAIATLNQCAYILCEDTRHSRKLLKHYEIDKPLKSFHQFNEAAREEGIIRDLQAGLSVGLISDAGTPGISDPGSRLVKRCVKEEIVICPIPGPSALLAAVVGSGLETARFQFVGFFPRKKGKLTRTLEESFVYPGTTIGYESPKRVEKVLRLLVELDPKRQVVIARELTKKFEEWLRGSAEELLKNWLKRPRKGEVVLLIEGTP